MKKLFKLTTLSFMGPFSATFFVVVFVLLLQFLWKYLDDLVGKGIPWYILGQLMFYASATFVPLALPLAILLSSIMSFGKLAESYELVALKSAGVSLTRIMVPMITVVSILGLGAFFFANNIAPRATLKYAALLWDVREQRPALDIQPGAFYSGIDNYTMRLGGKDDNTGNIQDVLIYDHSRGRGNDVVLVSDSGNMALTPDKKYLKLILYHGVRYEEMENAPRKRTFPHSRLAFKSYQIVMDLSGFTMQRTREELFKDNFSMLNISQLTRYHDSVEKVMDKRRTELRAYGAPYLAYLKDSAYYQKNATTQVVEKAGRPSYLSTLGRNTRMTTVNSALTNARSLRDAIGIQGEDILGGEKTLARYTMEWHRKFALAVACMTLFLIGAPLGAIIRKGGIGLPTVVSIVLFIFYYIISITGEKSAKEGAMDPILGMWLPTLILMPIGIFLTYRANNDKIHLENLGWQFRKLFGFIVLAYRKVFPARKAGALDA